MVGKKAGVVFGFLLLGILLIGVANTVSADDGCQVVERTACLTLQGNYIVMGLSASENAHGEKAFVTANNKYMCLGVVNPCSDYSDMFSCLSQDGCSWIEGGGVGYVITGFLISDGTCSGTATPCPNFEDEQVNCESQGGCTYGVKYDYVLCCDFGNGVGANECGGGERILRLSSSTNAHVEIPELSTYTEEVCYQHTGLGCVSGAQNPDPVIFNPVLSLSGETNAHVGHLDNYNNLKIWCNIGNTINTGTYCGDYLVQRPNDDGIMEECDDGNEGGVNNNGGDESFCTFGCLCDVENGYRYDLFDQTCEPYGLGEPIVYWASEDNMDFAVDSIDVIIGETSVLLVFKNSGYLEGEEVSFDIYEKDFWTPDDFIRTVIGSVVDFEGNLVLVASWTITQADIEATGETNFEGFYFEVYDSDATLYTSNDLEIDIIQAPICEAIIMCMDYSTQENCENDLGLCQVASYSVSLNNPEIDCSNQYITCTCAWNEITGCGPSWTAGYGGYDIGMCAYSENTDDNCDDMFLTYSWTAIWEWDASNNWDDEMYCVTNYNGDMGDCVEDPPESGFWHYDPELMNEECASGQNVVPCPARVQLSFFNIYNLIGAIIIIVLIYLVLNLRKKKKIKRRVVKKRKRKKKK